jgi:lysozyme
VASLSSSRRAVAAIAAVLAVSVGGYVTLPGGAKVHDDVVLAADTLVEPWEGVVLHAYLDRVAKPPVVTICAGDTTDVKMGMVETPAGCRQRLIKKMERVFRPALVKCIAGFDRKPITWRAMMDSLAWNIGTGAACNSTAAKLGRVDQYADSCNAATAFNKAGGRVVIGIVRRREMGDKTRIGEGELCFSGVVK